MRFAGMGTALAWRQPRHFNRIPELALMISIKPENQQGPPKAAGNVRIAILVGGVLALAAAGMLLFL